MKYYCTNFEVRSFYEVLNFECLRNYILIIDKGKHYEIFCKFISSLPIIIGEYWFYLQGENSCTTIEGEDNLVVDVNYDSFFVTIFN